MVEVRTWISMSDRPRLRPFDGPTGSANIRVKVSSWRKEQQHVQQREALQSGVQVPYGRRGTKGLALWNNTLKLLDGSVSGD